MKEISAIVVLVFGLSLTANADIWKWVDEQGNVHYGDTPASVNAAKAERVSHTPRDRSTSTSGGARKNASNGSDIDRQEASDQIREGDDAQAYYCERAKNIYESYVAAPRLYRTRDDGEREYLSDEEMAATLAEAEASVAEWCS